MKAVFTYWTNGKDVTAVNGGFNNLRDMAAMVALSIEYLRAKQPYITSIQLVTNSYGKRHFADRYQLPFDEVVTILDDWNEKLHPDHWAFAKLIAYNHQKQPFLHVDNDVVLWETLPKRLRQAPLFFQNRESMRTHLGYQKMLSEANGFLPKAVAETSVKYAYCCGIVGANRLDVIKDWFNAASEFVFDPKNSDYWNQNKDWHSTNHLFEQYFISALIASRKIEAGELLKAFKYGMVQNRITHLWGPSKRNQQTIDRLYNRLFAEFPQYRTTIGEQLPDHEDVFTNIYKNKTWGTRSGGGSSLEQTEPYRTMLSKFLKKNNIRKVVDLGCGYWDTNDLVDWNGASYHGIDVVSAVIDENLETTKNGQTFEQQDVRTCEIPECDLLIIKDVMIHWTNAEISNFLARQLPAKFVLITNDDRVSEQNLDIDIPGRYRDVDISKPPFNVPAKPFYKWPNVSKSTWLLTGSLREEELTGVGAKSRKNSSTTSKRQLADQLTNQ